MPHRPSLLTGKSWKNREKLREAKKEEMIEKKSLGKAEEALVEASYY